MTHITFMVLSKTDPYLHWALLKSQYKIDPEGLLDLKVQCHQRADHTRVNLPRERGRHFGSCPVVKFPRARFKSSLQASIQNFPVP